MDLRDWAEPPAEREPGILGWVREYIRVCGMAPPGAQIYIDGVEFKGTGDEFLDLVGVRDVDVAVSIKLPPVAEPIDVTITREALDS